MPIELLHPLIGVTFVAVCAMVTEILIKARRGG